MSTEKPVQQVEVVLIGAYTHKGVDYQAGAKIKVTERQKAFLQQAGKVDDPLTLPPPPDSDVTGDAPELIQLPTQLRGRGQMAYDDELDGFAGNYDELDIGTPTDAFPRRHQVTAPEVPAEHRDEFTASTARTYRVAIPNDLLEL